MWDLLLSALPSVLAFDDAEELEQAGEQVVDGNEERQRGADVVGFAAVDDFACLVQDHARHQLIL